MERYQNVTLPKYRMKELLISRVEHMATCVVCKDLFQETLCINRNASQLQDVFSFQLFTFDLYRHQTSGNAARPRCVMTSVRKSRGILSLDKHVALSAAVNFLEWQLAQSGILG